MNFILGFLKSLKLPLKLLARGLKKRKKGLNWRKNNENMCGILLLFIIVGKRVLGGIRKSERKENFL
jgi:hypothetical protein